MTWQRDQNEQHGLDHTYDRSPHARPGHVNDLINGWIRRAVEERTTLIKPCRVLDLGAGHGRFTDTLLSCGADVVATEMSRASADALENKYRRISRVTVLHDPGGDAVFGCDRFDVVLCISVLHHVPDYIALLERLITRVRPGGWLLTFQDPTWYPRRGMVTTAIDRACYYAWRLGQGNYTRGFQSLLRRRTGQMTEDCPSDMVEYHVVRQGVDEMMVLSLLTTSFETASLLPYWSTHSSLLQRVERTSLVNTFGVVARERLP